MRVQITWAAELLRAREQCVDSYLYLRTRNVRRFFAMDANDIFESLLTTEGRSDPISAVRGAAPAGRGRGAADRGGDRATATTRSARCCATPPSWSPMRRASTRCSAAGGSIRRWAWTPILNLNPPDHSRIRAPMARAFTQRRVSGLAPAIARMTDELLDVMAERGADGSPVEFMHDFAFLLPVTVICELLGIPEADRAGFRPLARDLAATVEVDVDLSVLPAADVAAVRLREYFAELAAERRAGPRDDLVSALVAISVPATPATAVPRLSADELLDNLTLLLVAGFETTTNLLGNGLRVILQQPAAGRRGQGRVGPSGRVRGGGAALRLAGAAHQPQASPVPPRSAGVRVPGGAEVIVLLGAGNRDPRRFAGAGPLRPAPAGRRAAQLRRGRALLPGRGPGPAGGRDRVSAAAAPVPAAGRGGRADAPRRARAARLRDAAGHRRLNRAGRAGGYGACLRRRGPRSRGRRRWCRPRPFLSGRYRSTRANRRATPPG